MIACCKEQNVGPCAAMDLYGSDLFKKCLAHARMLVADSNIFILSTNYGLLNLTTVISSYDVPVPVGGWKLLSSSVETAILKVVMPGDEIVFLAGEDYYKCLSLPGITMICPLKGKRIGEMMAYL